MIKALIIDDESNARETLKMLLAQHAKNVDVIGTAENAEAGFSMIESHKPDLVFLDVEMPKGTGFDLLERCEQVNFQVIFTTAYGHYAIKAIKFSALDYLLKPIDITELQDAVRKVEELLATSKSRENHSIRALIENLNNTSSKKIAIPDLEGITFVDLDDILRCEADRNYTCIYLQNGRKIVSSKVLKEYEKLFADYHFIRLHNSHIINMRHVKRYIEGEGGTVVMTDDSSVDVSRRRKSEFLERLGNI
jgi:two-component system LytT family response regulator